MRFGEQAISTLRSLWRQAVGLPQDLPPEGTEGIRALGAKEYVGGLWEEIGELQFRFLVDQGLRPEHLLLDVGCGCLRGGIRFIRYLEPGHYLGIDKEPLLLEAGKRELGSDLLREKRPELLASGSFAFHRFSRRPEWALAQSLLTHLCRRDLERCLAQLRRVMAPGGVFYATFFEAAAPSPNPRASHSLGYFAYTRKEMEELGSRHGWNPHYIGEWDHPRNQRLMLFRA
ncbi:class I SAM-dependent methyltransferase [Methylacidimicrobium sp. B4]|uniref:methyltransferase n=1 Tax=Methylacidimicrobium sp. B4 TaxID=2796139 RepID=UPI001A8D678B|nr:class I SAM-dependent methyltransferase [Methylacidimicrobium sp. B4]QSR84390.1 class I SAM-dependent methyltransferase [Methylacidimicrobium sp. B4]